MKGPPVKFPLLSKNYVINEVDDTNANMEKVYDNVSTKTKKSPLEVFHFPEPPKEPFPMHYTVKNSNGCLDEYAQPNLYKGPKLAATPAVFNDPIEKANYNPFDHNYSVISPSRYFF